MVLCFKLLQYKEGKLTCVHGENSGNINARSLVCNSCLLQVTGGCSFNS